MNPNWTNNPKLNQIAWDKRTFLQNFITKNKHSNMEELLPLILSLKQSMRKQNMSFTKEEEAILSEVLLENLSPQEKKSFELLKNMMT